MFIVLISINAFSLICFSLFKLVIYGALTKIYDFLRKHFSSILDHLILIFTFFNFKSRK